MKTNLVESYDFFSNASIHIEILRIVKYEGQRKQNITQPTIPFLFMNTNIFFVVWKYFIYPKILTQETFVGVILIKNWNYLKNFSG